MKVAAVLIGVLLATVVAAGAVVVAVEQRYQSCIAEAEARTPVYVGLVDRSGGLGGTGYGDSTGLATRARGVDERRRAVSGCERLP